MYIYSPLDQPRFFSFVFSFQIPFSGGRGQKCRRNEWERGPEERPWERGGRISSHAVVASFMFDASENRWILSGILLSNFLLNVCETFRLWLTMGDRVVTTTCRHARLVHPMTRACAINRPNTHYLTFIERMFFTFWVIYKYETSRFQANYEHSLGN